MNPVLLKPTSDTGSQVIVNGRPIGTMGARDYRAFRHNLVGDIMHAYDDLADRFDVIVIEGAGSPAEVNLKDGDIVNMGMAKMASAPVLLVGDIDRGGVFAQLLGTLMLLDDDERALCKGLIVNKFRGDRTILDPGLDILCERSALPVVGVIPYTILDIDDEDSLSDRLGSRGTAALVDIAVMRLPRISNFTDFIPLDAVECVGVRYVSHASDLGEPDLIIVPGTKSTLADLRWLRESGLEAAILKRAAAGTPVIGICGGYQMLGTEVSDPLGAEGGGTMRGFGLLPVRTVFEPGKRQVRSRGRVAIIGGVLSGLSGAPVEGYEIHMGGTERLDGAPMCELAGEGESARSAPDGCWRGNVYGTYLHGIFDTSECAGSLVRALLARKGIEAGDVQVVDMRTYREEQYDMLAQVIRGNTDMELVHRILEEGV